MNTNPMQLLIQMMGLGNNPREIIQNLVRQNPNYQFILNQMQTSGMSDKDFVMHYAKKNNINLQPMINFLQQKGIKL